MTSFRRFVIELLREGKVVFRSAQAPRDRPLAEDIALLEKGFEVVQLSVAGPAIPFDGAVGYSAAEVLRQASWALLNHNDRISQLKKLLSMPIQPATPAHHLSADLMLRYLPQVLKRARGLDPSDPLIGLLEDVLRRWPLSGVLSDVIEPPLGSLEFAGHPGLLLLYSERLVANDRHAWRPAQRAPGCAYYELASDERRRGQSSPAEFSSSAGKGAHVE